MVNYLFTTDNEKSNGLKVCTKCKLPKPLSEFGFIKSRNRYQAQCKGCRKLACKAFYQNNKDREKAKRAKWRMENRGRKRIMDNNYYGENKTRWLSYNANVDPFERFAREQLNLAVNAGRIFPPKICSVCDRSRKLDSHHFDYNLPLDVVWLCRECHKGVHAFLSHATTEYRNKFISALSCFCVDTQRILS